MDENILESLGSFSNESKESLEKSLIASQKIKNIGDSQDIEMRKDFATKTYNLVCIYLVVIFFLVFLVCCPAKFNMSDSVLITLLGTTTINVIGLFAIVMNYLFPKK
jgi:hypothetical protein